jgi:hypothetical protein
MIVDLQGFAVDVSQPIAGRPHVLLVVRDDGGHGVIGDGLERDFTQVEQERIRDAYHRARPRFLGRPIVDTKSAKAPQEAM